MRNNLKKLILLSTVAVTGLTAPAFADAGDWQVRGRLIGVLANGDGYVQGTSLATDVDNAWVPEVDVSYFLTDNIAAELIAATSEHTITAGGGVLGDAWILPPTLTVQYHFAPDAQFSPYVGAGINYSLFYGEDHKSPYTDLKVDGGFGYALQAGFDYWMNDKWGINADVKYIDLDVDVHVNNSALNAYDVDLDPWIVGAGVSYRF
jgi:outer membrane protein